MLNARIKQLRTAFNQSQVVLAKALRVSKQCVSNWENDNVMPSVEMLVKIAKYFNVSTDYLLGLSHDHMICLDGLKEHQIAHIKLLIDDLSECR